MAVVKEKVCRRENQRSIAFSGTFKKDGVEGVNSAASAAYLNKSLQGTLNLWLRLRFAPLSSERYVSWGRVSTMNTQSISESGASNASMHP